MWILPITYSITIVFRTFVLDILMWILPITYSITMYPNYQNGHNKLNDVYR